MQEPHDNPNVVADEQAEPAAAEPAAADDTEVQGQPSALIAALNNSSPPPTLEASYGAEKSGSELASYIEEVSDTVRIGFDQSIAILSPWFFNNMPDVYYQTTPKAEKIKHLSTIITGHVPLKPNRR